jgi:hypothetical protein
VFTPSGSAVSTGKSEAVGGQKYEEEGEKARRGAFRVSGVERRRDRQPCRAEREQHAARDTHHDREHHFPTTSDDPLIRKANPISPKSVRMAAEGVPSIRHRSN